MTNPTRFEEFIHPDVGAGIKELSKDFRSFFKEAEKLISNINKASERTRDRVKELRGEAKKARDELAKADPRTDFGRDAIDKATEKLPSLTSEYGKAQGAADGAGKATKALEGSVRAMENEIKKLTRQYKNLSPEQRKNSEQTQVLRDRLVKLKTTVFEANREVSRLNKTFKASEGSYAALTEQNRRINAVLSKLPLNFVKTNKRAQELQRTVFNNTKTLKEYDAAINRSFRNVGNYASAFEGLGKTVKSALLPIGGAILIVNTLRQALQSAIRTNISISDSFADVQKTTNLTSNEVERLNQQLQGLNTRTSQEGLLSIATAAGRLNIAKDDLLDFTREVDKAFVALGDELGGSAEDIATSIGKISAVFGAESEFGAAEGINRVGSAINFVSANSKAASPFLVDFSKRLAGIAPGAKISVANVIGLAAAADELGQTAETSATGIGQFLIALGKDIPKFSKIAGKSVEEFTELLSEDANEAFLITLEAANNTDGGLVALADTFEKLGIEGARQSTVLGALAGNIDLVRKNQKNANIAFDEGTSLTEEFNIKNNNLAGSADRLGKALTRAATSGRFSEFLKASIEGVTGLVNAFNDFVEIPISEKLIEEQTELNTLVTAITAANVTQESRNGLIEELQKKYPDFLKNLDTETVTNEQLRDRLKEVNEQLEQKIILQLSEEEQAKLIKEQISLRLRERDLLKEIATESERSQSNNIGQATVSQLGLLNLELDSNRERQRLVAEELEKVNQKYRDIVKTGEDFNKAVDKTKDKIEEVDGEVDEVSNSLKNWENPIEKIEKLDLRRTQQLRDILKDPDFFNFIENSTITEDLVKSFGDALPDIEGVFDRIKEMFDQLNEDLTDAERKQKEKREALLFESFNFANTIFDSISQLSSARTENELTALEEKRAKELELAEGNERAQAEINERFDQKQKELRQKQAKRDKAVALFRVPINVATGITAALTNPATAPVVIPFIIATGAVQAATIASTPLPQFFKGVEDLPQDTLAWTGEKGRELGIEGKTGQPFLTPGKATLTYLTKGTTILPNPETERILSGQDIPPSMLEYKPDYLKQNAKKDAIVNEQLKNIFSIGFNDTNIVNAVNENTKRTERLEKAINNMTMLSPAWLNGKVHASLQDKNQKKIYLDDRLKK